MKIIVDMMGGDNAPLAVLEGAAAAVKEYGVQLIGVGDEALVRKTAADNNISLDGIELVNCTEVIEMCDEPARAIRTKKDSSIVVGLNMLKEGKGDAFVSAGSTGALHVGASLIVRTLRGIKRPALATMVPAKNKAYLLLDCGANVECLPQRGAGQQRRRGEQGYPHAQRSPSAAQDHPGHPLCGQHRAP